MAKKTKTELLKKSKSKSNNSKIVIIVSVIIVLVILSFLALKLDLVKVTNEEQNQEEIKEENQGIKEEIRQGIAAEVNGETIDYSTLDKQYTLFFVLTDYPEEYKEVITKEKYLGQLVVESLLLQEAEKEGILTEKISEDEVTILVDNYISQLESSKEEFVKKLVDNKLTIDEVTEYFKRQKVMMELLNSTVLAKIEVTDEMIETYYEENKEGLEQEEYSEEEIKEGIKLMLLAGEQRTKLQEYLEMLKEESEIIIN